MVAEFEFDGGASRLYQGPCDLSLQNFEHSHEFANLQWHWPHIEWAWKGAKSATVTLLHVAGKTILVNFNLAVSALIAKPPILIPCQIFRLYGILSFARNRVTVWISLNMHTLSNDLWTARAVAVYFLDASKVWVVWYAVVYYSVLYFHSPGARENTVQYPAKSLAISMLHCIACLHSPHNALRSPSIMRLYYLVCRLSELGNFYWIHIAGSNHWYYYVLLYVLYISYLEIFVVKVFSWVA